MKHDLKDPTIKVIAMPQDTNPNGDIFGGWIVSMMDLAGVVAARRTAPNRFVTVAMDNIVFHKPVFVGDFLQCYCKVNKIGNTSITVDIDVYVERRLSGEVKQVTNGQFVYVAVNEDGKPVKVITDKPVS